MMNNLHEIFERDAKNQRNRLFDYTCELRHTTHNCSHKKTVLLGSIVRPLSMMEAMLCDACTQCRIRKKRNSQVLHPKDSRNRFYNHSRLLLVVFGPLSTYYLACVWRTTFSFFLSRKCHII